jgi:hypothetical protein
MDFLWCCGYGSFDVDSGFSIGTKEWKAVSDVSSFRSMAEEG